MPQKMLHTKESHVVAHKTLYEIVKENIFQVDTLLYDFDVLLVTVIQRLNKKMSRWTYASSHEKVE